MVEVKKFARFAAVCFVLTGSSFRSVGRLLTNGRHMSSGYEAGSKPMVLLHQAIWSWWGPGSLVARFVPLLARCAAKTGCIGSMFVHSEIVVVFLVYPPALC